VNWLVELVDGTTIYHEGALHAPNGSGLLTLMKPILLNGYIHMLYERVQVSDIMEVRSTRLTPEELRDQGIFFRESE